MGGPVIIIPDNSAWDALSTIISDPGFKGECEAQWTSSNHVGPAGFEEVSGKYEALLHFCPGDKVNGSLSGSTVTTTTASGSCPSGSPDRIPDSRNYDFLEYVLDQSPAGITGQFPDTIVDFMVSNDGSKYEAEFTFEPDGGGANYTKTASATLGSGGFGPITVTP